MLHNNQKKKRIPIKKGEIAESRLANTYLASIEQLRKINPKASAKSRIRAIGNSKGIILSNHLIKIAGLNIETDVVVQAADGIIYIVQLKSPDINTDLSTWDKQFKSAIKKGDIPESDPFKDVINDFDLKVW